MLIVYFVDFGVTQVVVPTFLRPYLGAELFNIGTFYMVSFKRTWTNYI
jgi:UDP-N-acetylglucosamine--dolichyl-phosphate N-acetylglucosaminephosphotransferase